MSVLGVRDCVGGKPLDAMADAETLREIAMYSDTPAWSAGYSGVDAASYAVDGMSIMAWTRAKTAAHQAFLACPALREEA